MKFNLFSHWQSGLVSKASQVSAYSANSRAPVAQPKCHIIVNVAPPSGTKGGCSFWVISLSSKAHIFVLFSARISCFTNKAEPEQYFSYFVQNGRPVTLFCGCVRWHHRFQHRPSPSFSTLIVLLRNKCCVPIVAEFYARPTCFPSG